MVIYAGLVLLLTAKSEPSAPDSASNFTSEIADCARAAMADARTNAHTSRRKKLPEENFVSLTTLVLVRVFSMMLCRYLMSSHTADVNRTILEPVHDTPP